jgi:hypothetical protein
MIARQHPTETRNDSNFARPAPSPSEIRRATALIRRQWTRATRLKRLGQRPFLSAVIELPSAPRRKGFIVA